MTLVLKKAETNKIIKIENTFGRKKNQKKILGTLKSLLANYIQYIPYIVYIIR